MDAATDKIEPRESHARARSIALIPVASFAMAMAMAMCGCAQVTPSHKIPARPEYIEAGVQAGDRVEITTKDGRQLEIVVEAVENSTIKGASDSIAFADIESLVKRSWTTPTHPCGENLPLGCSVPEAVLVLSKEYARQADRFHAACVSHDFCYRHGFATYGLTREECDTAINEDMKKACRGPAGLGILDVKDYSKCVIAADQTYQAIRRHGEEHFKTSASTYCEYRVEP